MKKIYRTIFQIIPPFIFILLGYLLCFKADTFSKQQLYFLLYLPYAIMLLTAFLAWKFNRSRIFFLSLLFTVSLYTQYYQTILPSDAIPIVLTVLLPINVVVFSFLKERGILSPWGFLRFGFILTEICFAHYMISSGQQNILQKLGSSLPAVRIPALNISHTALPVFFLCFLAIMLRILLYHEVQDISHASVMAALFLLFNHEGIVEASIFYSTIGLIYIASVLRDTYYYAFTDELTGLSSRRALNQDMMKLGMRYSIAMLDIDFFKRFNDIYGHDTGDEALKFIASLIKGVKNGGKAYRYGGEEFTLLFPGKNTKDVLPALEDLRETIAHRAFVIRRKRSANSLLKNKASHKTRKRKPNPSSKRTFIHVSIGVAHKDDTNRTPAMVLKAADKALYRAKHRGRNCVIS